MAKLNHIEISCEDAIRQYGFLANMNAPKSPSRDRKIHGVQLKNELSEAVNYSRLRYAKRRELPVVIAPLPANRCETFRKVCAVTPTGL